MKQKQAKRKSSRTPYLAGAVLLAVVVFMLVWPQATYQQAQQEICDEQRQRSPLRFRVINAYSDYIYINVDYTWGTAIPSETWGIKPGIGAVTVYTRNLFTTENNVTVTLTAYSSQTVAVLQEKPIKFSLLTIKLVLDENYYADVRSTWTSTTSTTLNLDCVSDYVFDGPLFVAGL